MIRPSSLRPSPISNLIYHNIIENDRLFVNCLKLLIKVCHPLCYVVSVRLEGGRNRLHGRLLVDYDGLEGTVCSKNFGKTEAGVVCRMLNYA